MKAGLFTVWASTIAVAAFQACGGTTTAKVGATKIHGGGYKCESFETSPYLTAEERSDMVDYGILASSAYVDRNDADPGMNNGQGRVDNWKLLEDKGYRPLTLEETKRLLNGSGLNVSETHLSGDKQKGLDYVTTVNVSGNDPTTLNIRLFADDKGSLVVAYRGTAGVSDIVDDAKQVSHLGATPQQYKDAAKALQAIVANSASDPRFANIVCTGHSLGGGLVQYAMASTDLQDRVKGYTYNSAGLNGLETVNSFDEELAKKAAANIVGVRNDRDPVSFVGYHLLEGQRMYEVTTNARKGEHSIQSLVVNMSTTTGTDLTLPSQQTPAQTQAPTQAPTQTQTQASTQAPTQTQQSGQPSAQSGQGASSNGDLSGMLDLLQDALSSVMPGSDAADIADAIEKLGGCFGGSGSGGDLTSIIAEIASKIPDGAPRKALDALVDSMSKGKTTLDDILAFGKETVCETIRQSCLDAGVSIEEAAKIAAECAEEAIQHAKTLYAQANSGTVSTLSSGLGSKIKAGATSIATKIRTKIGEAVKNKIEQTLGKDAADKWEQVWTDIKSGNNPWKTGSLGDAVKETVFVLVDKAIDKLGDMAWKRLEALAAKYPAVGTAMQALGITKDGLIGAAKNVWGILTGPGSLSNKLRDIAWSAAQGLAKMAKNFLAWLGGKAAAWINAQISKIAGRVWSAIQSWIAKLPTFGGRVNYAKIYAQLVGTLGTAVSKGISKVIAPVAEKVETVMTNAAHKIIYGGP